MTVPPVEAETAIPQDARHTAAILRKSSLAGVVPLELDKVHTVLHHLRRALQDKSLVALDIDLQTCNLTPANEAIERDGNHRALF
jgi:hypothetical protein